MISRLLIGVVFLALAVTVGGFIVMAAWDVPVAQKHVEKQLETSPALDTMQTK